MYTEWCDHTISSHESANGQSVEHVDPTGVTETWLNMIMCAIFHFASSWLLPLSGLYVIPTAGWMMHESSPMCLLKSFCLSVFYLTSPQGETSQYSPASGRLRDQKRVLPLPWTVSLDVWRVAGKGFLLVPAELYVLIIDSWGMSCCSLGLHRNERLRTSLIWYSDMIALLAAPFSSARVLGGFDIYFHGYAKCMARYSSCPLRTLQIVVLTKMIKQKCIVINQSINMNQFFFALLE